MTVASAARGVRVVHKVRKLGRLLVVPAYWRGLRHGVAAAVEHEGAALDHDYRTVVDVGANRGQFLLVAARRFPRADLLAFEPLPAAGQVVRRALGRRPVEVFAMALAATAGTAILHVARADDSSSLLPISARQTSTFPGTDEVDRIEVRTARLDEVLVAPDLARPILLKIDAQGGELAVLQGATGLLDAVATVLVECSFEELYEGQPVVDEVVRFLGDAGFGLHSVGSLATAHGARPVQADFVFERRAGA
jgi:FkbM family methyltransferase